MIRFLRFMRTAVVIPTYNERDNILPLLDALLALPLPDLSVLVVDDASPDGTGDAVRGFAATHPRVSLLSRPEKAGLGKAYTDAFSRLFAEEASRHTADSVPEAIIQMDADFSHNPQDVPRLLDALSAKDLAIGSRYVPGGGVANWSRRRQFLSRMANQYARFLTKAPIHDLTGGFNAWRTEFLRGLDPASVTADGYGYLVAMKVRAARRGARMSEVPITFTERRSGQSKMSTHVVREAAWLAVKLGFFTDDRAGSP